MPSEKNTSPVSDDKLACASPVTNKINLQENVEQPAGSPTNAESPTGSARSWFDETAAEEREAALLKELAALKAQLAAAKAEPETVTAEKLRQQAIELDKTALKKVLENVGEKQAELDDLKGKVETAERVVDGLRNEFSAKKVEMEKLQKEKERLMNTINGTILPEDRKTLKQTTAADLAKKPAKTTDPTPREGQGVQVAEPTSYQTALAKALIKTSVGKDKQKIKASIRDASTAVETALAYFFQNPLIVDQILTCDPKDIATFNGLKSDATDAIIRKDDPKQHLYFCAVYFVVSMMQTFAKYGENWVPHEKYSIVEERHVVALQKTLSKLTGVAEEYFAEL
jgi:phage gp36-like protein